MCTLSYIPLSEGFVLTSNRDELENRKTRPPQRFSHADYTLIYPRDEVAGGTWIAVNESGLVICLLNGAFDKHQRKLPYRKSRGQIVLDCFKYGTIESIVNEIELSNIEPFTLLLLDYSDALSFVELRWDGLKKHLKTLDSSKAQIWSSAMLYSKKVRRLREEWFNDWLQNNLQNRQEHIMAFHNWKHSDVEEQNVVMKTDFGLRTVSISQLIFMPDKHEFNYLDLLSKESKTIDIQLLE